MKKVWHLSRRTGTLYAEAIALAKKKSTYYKVQKAHPGLHVSAAVLFNWAWAQVRSRLRSGLGPEDLVDDTRNDYL